MTKSYNIDISPSRTKIAGKIVRGSIFSASADPFSSGSLAYTGQPAFSSEAGHRAAEVRGLATGPSTTALVNLSAARRRARYAVLVAPYAKRAVDIVVSNVVGSGHRLKSLAPDEEFAKKIEKLWKDWEKVADTTGQQPYSGLEALAFRSAVEGGDSFVRMRTRRPADGLPVPLQLQVIEAEQVPHYKNETVGEKGLGQIVGGIQYDTLGKPVFYHMFKNHPGDYMTAYSGSNVADTVKVPAENICHIHDVRRPSDGRGLPWLSQMLITLSDLDRFMDAELVRKKAVALIGGFILEPPDASEDSNPFVTGRAGNEDADEVEIEAMEPGSFPVLPPGYDVRFTAPADVGGNFAVFIKQQLARIAASMNITYEQLSGDLSEINDRTLRATMLEFKRFMMALQKNIVIFQFHNKIFARWFDMAILSGALVIPDGMEEIDARRVRWIADPWQHLNPNQEVTAEKDHVRSGFKSRSEVIIAQGRDPEEVDQEIAEDKKRSDALGLVFDTEPTKVSRVGVAQMDNEPSEAEDETEGDSGKDKAEEEKKE